MVEEEEERENWGRKRKERRVGEGSRRSIGGAREGEMRRGAGGVGMGRERGGRGE